VIFENYSYDDALIGVTIDNRAVYDFDKMVTWLEDSEGMTTEEAIEWIEYNTIRSLPYAGPCAPLVMYPVSDLENRVERFDPDDFLGEYEEENE
jgi:hypothetical protein